MVKDSPLQSPEWTPDQPSRESLGLGGGSVSENAMNPSLWFFLHKHEYIELELTLEEHQGPHEAGGRTPTLVYRVWAPWPWFFHKYFLYIPKIISVDFQPIPRTFISAQKQHHGSSAKNNVSPG